MIKNEADISDSNRNEEDEGIKKFTNRKNIIIAVVALGLISVAIIILLYLKNKKINK